MELRVLRYFLAVAREESICRAAEYLHLSQPTLSRQLSDMEKELGKTLFIRGSRRITLTEEGSLLRKRASEILDLVEKTASELTSPGDSISGDIYIGAGETEALRFLTQRARQLQEQHPRICFHISSGDTADVTEQLDKGLIDFGLLFDPINHSKYSALQLPVCDTWGILMREDSPLAQKDAVTSGDLLDQPLVIPRRGRHLQPGLQRLLDGEGRNGVRAVSGPDHQHRRGQRALFSAPRAWGPRPYEHRVEKIPDILQGLGKVFGAAPAVRCRIPDPWPRSGRKMRRQEGPGEIRSRLPAKAPQWMSTAA